jgi:antirestriction protein ArdC
VIKQFRLQTSATSTAIEEARKYADRLVTLSPNAEARENVARALSFAPPAILDLLIRNRIEIVLTGASSEPRDTSPVYQIMPDAAREIFDRAEGLYVSSEHRIYLRHHDVHPALLIHEVGHAVDHCLLRERQQVEPEKYPPGLTLHDVDSLDSVKGITYLSSLSQGRFIGLDSFADRLAESFRAAETPSPYSAAGSDEHFAECLRFYLDTGSPTGSFGAVLGSGLRSTLEARSPIMVALLRDVVAELETKRERALAAEREVQAEVAPVAIAPAAPELTPDEPAKGKRDYRQEITERLVKELEAGRIPWEKPWEVSLPFNAARGNRYHGINQLMLMITSQDNGWKDPRWMTYKQASEKEWQVRKGERGTMVEYWKPPERLTDTEIRKRFAREKKKNPSVEFDGFKDRLLKAPARWQVFYAVVFNAAQIDVPKRDLNNEIVKEAKEIDGKTVEVPIVAPLTEAVPWGDKRHEIEPVERVEKLLAATGAKIEHAGTRAYYTPSRDAIVMPPRESFKSKEGYYGTLLHETGHWTGHKDRLDRSELQKGAFGSELYAREELRAELSSVFLSAETGLQYDVTRHAAYLQSWVGALRNDKHEIFRASRDAERIADYVLAFEYGKTLEVAAEITNEKASADASPLNIASLPIVEGARVRPPAFDFAGRVVGRSADGEEVLIKLGGQTVGIEREAFTSLPGVGEKIDVKHVGVEIRALSEKEAVREASLPELSESLEIA